MLISNNVDITKKPILVPNRKGLAKIINFNDTNAKVKMKQN